MKSILSLCACGLALVTTAPSLHAMISRSDAEISRQFERASAVFEGRVIAAESFVSESGAIKTRYSIRVSRPHKGVLPGVVSLTLLGGKVGNVAEAVGCQPSPSVGQEQLFFLSEGEDGSLGPVSGSASVLKSGSEGFRRALGEVELMSLTAPLPAAALVHANANSPLAVEGPVIQAISSSATNLLTSGGIGARFLQPDQGIAIPYLVDVEALPAGMSQNTALNAVSNALSAWEAVSSVRFEYQGLQTFGQAANTVSIEDGALRIQLHDLYGAITSGTTLGIGGRSHLVNVTPSDWTTGGQVFGNDFHGTLRGYVVLKHTKTSMQDALTFEEVLCHEVGHALSMAHSTPDTPATPGSPAWEAQMYYLAHQDGRGAFPTGWDTNVLNQVHPIANTPPHMFPRVMDIVTHFAGAPAVSGINEIQLTAYDLQTTNVSLAVADSNADSGVFALTTDMLSYTPGGFIGAGRLDPSTSSSYERIYGRCSDGTHFSPYISLRVIAFYPDFVPSPSDGIPDDWMTTNGWNADPAIGTNHGANDDADGDTIINIDEFRSWMDPNSATSAQLASAAPDGTVSWQGKAYELYELRGSTNLTDWFFVRAVLPTNDTPSVTVDPSTYGSVTYRAFKVP